MKQQIVFIHPKPYEKNNQKQPRYTYAFEMPSYNALMATAITFLSGHMGIPTMTFNFGIAMCSPKDQYCNQTGREVAESKMVLTTFTPTAISCTNDDIVSLTVQSDNTPKNIKFVFIIYKRSKKVFVFQERTFSRDLDDTYSKALQDWEW